MPRILAILVSAFLLTVGIVFVLLEMFKFLGISRMSKSRRQKERLALLDMIKMDLDNPAPYDVGELDLVSSEIHSNTKKKFFSRLKHGQLQSIYGEPIIGFAARIYSARQYVLVFAHEKADYCAMGLGNKTMLYKGEDLLGEVRGNDLYVGNKTIAEVKRTSQKVKSYYVEGKEFAQRNILNGKEVRLIDRMFQMVMEKEFTSKNIDLFTAYMGYDVIMEHIKASK